MKFRSKIDIQIRFFILLISSLLLALLLYKIFFEKYTNDVIVFNIIMLFVIGVLLWMHYGTHYELTESELHYKSGPIRGKIKIAEITEIIKDKTLWSGLKPATARKGLIIKLGKFDEIYISPESNELFVDKILEINTNIKITTTKDYKASSL